MPIFPGPFPAGDDEAFGVYATQLAKLLPPGVVWDLEGSADLRKVLAAVGGEFDRLRARGADVLRESSPATASETLGEWEAMLSLPDDQFPVLPATDAARRTIVTAKYVAQGGQSYAYFDALCTACGWPLLEILQGPAQALRVDDRVNDRVFGDIWAHSMELVLDTPGPAALAQAGFEAFIRHATQSHIVVIFTY